MTTATTTAAPATGNSVFSKSAGQPEMDQLEISSLPGISSTADAPLASVFVLSAPALMPLSLLLVLLSLMPPWERAKRT